MNRNDEPNTDKDHSARRGAWVGILMIYGVLAVALTAHLMSS